MPPSKPTPNFKKQVKVTVIPPSKKAAEKTFFEEFITIF